MPGSAAFLFLLLLSYTPNTCRSQPPSGAPVIMETKNLLAMTAATVMAANNDASKIQATIKETISNLRQNATLILERIHSTVNATLDTFQDRIERLVTNSSGVNVSDCAMSSLSVNSAAAKILKDANSCVSNAMESTERELNDRYSSIDSILGRINSDQNLAETCVAEYNKTEMALRNAIVTALCVSQAKERILSAIKDELSTRINAVSLYYLYIDTLIRMLNCDDNDRLSPFVTYADFIYVKIMTCISN